MRRLSCGACCVALCVLFVDYCVLLVDLCCCALFVRCLLCVVIASLLLVGCCSMCCDALRAVRCVLLAACC